MTSIREQFQQEITGPGLPFVAFCIALNLSAGQLASLLKLPIYLDSVGTVLVAVLCGPWSAMVAGVLSNVLASAFGNPAMMFFSPVMIVIGGFTGILARLGWFRHWYLVPLGGALQGVLAAVVSAPIATYLFSGVMLTGTDVLVLYFRSVGNSILQSVFYQGLSSDPVDKIITYVLVYLLCRNLPLRVMQRFRGGNNIPRPAGANRIHAH